MSKTRADDPDEVLRRLRLELIPNHPQGAGRRDCRNDLRALIHVLAQALREEDQEAAE